MKQAHKEPKEMPAVPDLPALKGLKAALRLKAEGNAAYAAGEHETAAAIPRP